MKNGLSRLGLASGFNHLIPSDTVKIKNIKDTSGLSCNCGSWLDHWVKQGGSKLPQFCSVVGCKGTDLDGAHVHKVGDTTVYIVPLCKEHNNPNNSGTMEIRCDCFLASANPKATCQKTKTLLRLPKL